MRKKILFVYPSSYDEKNNLIKSKKSFIPSRALPYLAALTPERFDTYIIDELVDNIDFNADVDLVALTGMLRHMPRAFDIAGEFRSRGKQVIIGGVGAYSIQGQIEKSGNFDSHIKGEVDESWPYILEDFEQGKLQKVYECVSPRQLNGFPPARFDLLNTGKYLMSFWDKRHPVTPIETSRGCPHNCDFCLVTRYFGKKIRYRPVGEVVQEIKNHGAQCILFTDDNIAINPDRTRELLMAIKPLNIKWLAQFESKVIQYPDILRLAGESGCVSAIVGVESLIDANLYSVNKIHNLNMDLKLLLKSFNDAGIPLIASIIFGFEQDTPEIIAWTIQQMIENEVDGIIPWILTPIPGTPFYDECKKKGRIIHENYSFYDHWHVVLRPELMTPLELEKAFWQGLKQFYSYRQILGRMISMDLDDIPGILYHFYFHNQIRNELHPISSNM